jgi:uncharacterized protein YkwD
VHWAVAGAALSSMGTTRFRTGLRTAQVALALLTVAVLVASPDAARAHGKQAGGSKTCAATDTQTTNVRQVQKAILCLHNLERGARGLSKLRWNRDLTGVASKYARTMVSGRFFGHYSAGHRDHMDRIAASAYKPSSGCWTAGENLYSSAGPATPRRILSAWMASPAHRQNILHKGWHDFGLGVVSKSPEGNSKGLTIVALFGLRTHRNCS